MAVNYYDTESITLMDGRTINMKMEESNMDEKTKNEIEQGANLLGLSAEDAQAKYEDICTENGVENTSPIGLGLWRSYVAQSRRANSKSNSGGNGGGSNSLSKKAFGFFISLESPRDTMVWNRNKAKEEYARNPDSALESGLIATAEETDGGWKVLRVFKGEYQERIVKNLHEGAEEVNGQMIIPLDATDTYPNGGKNKLFGKPLPAEEFRRTGVFYGMVGDSTEMKPYFFSYKKEGCLEFTPNCFEYLHMTVIKNESSDDIYGYTSVTKSSLVMNVELDPDNSDYRDVSGYNYVNTLTDAFADKVCELVDIDRQHTNLGMLPVKQRYVITDGTVCNMNMTAFGNGNRVLNITDLNAEFDYEGGNNMTTCWVPEHINIDFGIGSNIIIIGRTSQRQGDDGPEPVTVNVSGILVIERVGSPVEIEQFEETNEDWFS
tara:strand:+ start:103 stop:1407 length:1305 start_codon:yes stop_codon:yes gene_type:complete